MHLPTVILMEKKIPFEDLLPILQKIVRCVKIPVTADVESGYAENKVRLKENIKKLIDVGIVGMNLEDSAPGAKVIIPVAAQCEKICLIRETAIAMGCPIFINARTDVYLKENALSEHEKRSATIQRGKPIERLVLTVFIPSS